MTGILADALRSVAQTLPKLLAFLVILALGYLVGRMLFKVVDRGLQRVGFDRAVERSSAHQALARANLDATDLLARLVYYAVLLFTLQLAFRIWGPNPISDLLGAVLAWLPRAAVAIVIVVVASAIARRVRDLVATALSGLSYGRTLALIASWFIAGLGIVAALNQVGVATTVTMPVLITVLATAGGIAVVGLGGGLIRPMQQRWERWLDRADQESATISERARAYGAGQAHAREAASGPAATAAPGSDRVGASRAGGNRAGADRAGGNRAGADRAGADRAAGNRTGANRAVGNPAGSSPTGGNRPGGNRGGGVPAAGSGAGGARGAATEDDSYDDARTFPVAALSSAAAAREATTQTTRLPSWSTAGGLDDPDMHPEFGADDHPDHRPDHTD